MIHNLSTEPYKGTRDFYPKEMAVQRYIFDVWAKTAESFGYERYDASILEPSELYKSKGAENEEMVNDQTYTFVDRGDREVTLRPEMTPTVARMVAGKRRELSFPVRWYSIPNLYRYERPQRGRLREFWQLNCDMFGATHNASDVEVIALAHKIFTSFGATEDMFRIHLNSRKLMQEQVTDKLITPELFPKYLALIDKKTKMTASDFATAEKELLKEGTTLQITVNDVVQEIISSLSALGISNVVFDPTITRGFNYYTGTVFEIFDTSTENNRAMMGGGRFDNLTELFDGEPISGIGFGIGDVIMHDFLLTHGLLEGKIASTAPQLMIIPMDATQNIEGEKIAQQFRERGVRVAVDISDKKVEKKRASAEKTGVTYLLMLGEHELTAQIFTLKKLDDRSETTGTLPELIQKFQ